MSFIVSILVAFFIGFTGSAQATEAPVSPVQAVQEATVDPILKADADLTIGDYDIAYVEGQVLDYVETLDSKPSVDELYTFTLESIDFPGHFHKYVVKTIHTA